MIAPNFEHVSAAQLLRKAGDVQVVAPTDDIRLASRVLSIVLRNRRVPFSAFANIARVRDLIELVARMSRNARAVTFDVPIEDALMGGLSIAHLVRNHAVPALAESARKQERGAIKPGHQGEATAALGRIGELMVAAARAGAAGIGEVIPAGEASP